MDIQRIIEIDRFALDAGFLMPDADLAEVAMHKGLAPNHIDFAAGQILLGVQSMLLRHGGLNILIDTCVGGCKERPRRAEWHRIAPQIYLSQLAAAGVTPDEIDIVFCTHLHADHVGWNTRLEDGRWVPTFPNARYLVSRTELDHWIAEEASAPGQHNHGSFADSVLPVIEAGLFDKVEDGFSLGHGMHIAPLPGHSPGQIGLELHRSGHAPVCFCGDAFHNVVQAHRPAWHSRFCHDPAQSTATRITLMDRSAQEGLVIVPSHIRGEMGFTWSGKALHMLEHL